MHLVWSERQLFEMVSGAWTDQLDSQEDHPTRRTGHGPVNLATLPAAVIDAVKDAGYLYVPERQRDHTTPAETIFLHGLT